MYLNKTMKTRTLIFLQFYVYYKYIVNITFISQSSQSWGEFSMFLLHWY